MLQSICTSNWRFLTIGRARFEIVWWGWILSLQSIRWCCRSSMHLMTHPSWARLWITSPPLNSSKACVRWIWASVHLMPACWPRSSVMQSSRTWSTMPCSAESLILHFLHWSLVCQLQASSLPNLSDNNAQVLYLRQIAWGTAHIHVVLHTDCQLGPNLSNYDEIK